MDEIVGWRGLVPPTAERAREIVTHDDAANALVRSPEERAGWGAVLAGSFDVDVAPRQARVLSSATELKAGYSRIGQPRPRELRRLLPGTGNGIGFWHRSAALPSGNEDVSGRDDRLLRRECTAC